MIKKNIGLIILGIFTTLVPLSCSVNQVQQTSTLDVQPVTTAAPQTSITIIQTTALEVEPVTTVAQTSTTTILTTTLEVQPVTTVSQLSTTMIQTTDLEVEPITTVTQTSTTTILTTTLEVQPVTTVSQTTAKTVQPPVQATTIGAIAPIFTLADMNGKATNIADFRGENAVLLLFINPNTGPPFMNELINGYVTRYSGVYKLQTILVSDLSSTSPEQQKAMATGGGCCLAQSTAAGFPLLDVYGNISKDFGASVNAFTVVLIDFQGQIRYWQIAPSIVDDNTELSKLVDQVTHQ
jgi:peroxiredoxin